MDLTKTQQKIFDFVVKSIAEDNIISQQLFLKAGFKLIGQRKDWTLVNGKFKNENLYQHIYVH